MLSADTSLKGDAMRHEHRSQDVRPEGDQGGRQPIAAAAEMLVQAAETVNVQFGPRPSPSWFRRLGNPSPGN